MGGGLVQATIAPVWKAASRSHFVTHGEGHIAAYAYDDKVLYMAENRDEFKSFHEDIELLKESST